MIVSILQVIQNLVMQGLVLYRYALVIYFLLSWMPGGYQSGIGQFLTRICEPYVSVFRQFVPPIGMISLAGLVAFFALNFIEYGVAAVFNILYNLLMIIG
ncbi:YggT family protein [Alkalibacterium sp. MB6]|uniref:YggT family protein n=1 Tax=Alkalibacterium sp. MB6 TaxID=2081965 RepID=UPI00192A5D47|nr:YggT family protein [Alkalibacterium sp. MB6]